MINISSSEKLVKPKTQLLIPEIPLGLARRILMKEAPTAVVYEIVDGLLGHTRNDIDAWEPETIWKEMSRMGIDLDVLQRDQVMVVTALRKRTDLIFTTGFEFKNVVLPINHEVPMTDRDEIVDVEHMCWCIDFMNEYFSGVPFFVDHGALEYVAGILHSEGYFVPPTQLDFAADRLTKLNKNAYDYADMVRERVSGSTKKMSPIITVQLQKMERAEQYSKGMLDTHRIGMKRLLRSRT